MFTGVGTLTTLETAPGRPERFICAVIEGIFASVYLWTHSARSHTVFAQVMVLIPPPSGSAVSRIGTGPNVTWINDFSAILSTWRNTYLLNSRGEGK